MKNKLKIWSGVGTYFLANVGAIALSTTDVARADMSLLTADESNVLISQGGEGSSGKTCKAVAVSGGGEGGEESATPTSGGEGGEGGSGEAPTPSTQPTGGGEGGEGGEGGSGEAPTQPTGGGEGGEGGGEGGEGGEGGGEGGTGASGGTTIFKPRSSQPAVGNNARASVKFDDRQLLNDFTDQLVIPTYRALAGKSGQLSTVVNAFVSKPNSSTLNAARQAWLATRTPWEQSEAFAFGPAASLGYDADLDDWPINEVDLNKVLNSQNALTADYVSKLQTSQKGFHTIEFLLFGVDNNKQLQNFTKRDLEYLQAVTTAFDRTANQLLTSWTEGVNGNPPYRDTFVKAGNDSTAYPTVQAAAEEIVQGILGILDEVGSTKIGEALEEQNPFLLESRFSNSSLRDFQANLRSAQIAYLGQLPDAKTRGKSLSEFVASVDPALDTEVRQQMQSVLTTLAAVPGPIERTLCDSQAITKIEAAKDAILGLHTTIQKRVLPLVQE